MKGLGEHFLAEFFECDTFRINDVELMESIMKEAADLSGATLIKSFFHQFTPHGISGVLVIAESHMAIHCWPEYGYTAVDIFSCSEFDYRSALDHIRDSIQSEKYTVSVVERGILPGTVENTEKLQMLSLDDVSEKEKDTDCAGTRSAL